MAAIVLSACGRLSSSSAATVTTVYAGGVRLSDIGSVLGDSSNWWPGPPQFSVRPLDSSVRPEQERFDVLLRFLHNGSNESVDIQYRVWDSSATASAVMSSLQQAFGTSLNGPSAGDQVLYYNQNVMVGAAPYQSLMLVRVGQIQIVIRWNRIGSFASTNAQGTLAKRVVSKLKSSLSSSSHPAKPPAPDPHLLPPDGPDLTLLGTDTLPVEVIAQMVQAPAPADVAAMFHSLGATTFMFGDYALNADTHMEVQTSALTFSSSTGATDWLNQFIGQSNLDQGGNYFNYDAPTGQYIAAFGVGSEGVLMTCRSAADLEAASRACESPLSRVAGAWKTALGG